MPFLSRSREPELPAPLPYDPSSPEGLAARWVRWVAAAGPLANPVEDEDGRHAAANQPDDVWFLAGTSGKRMQRSCVVPVGRPLFLPAFTMWECPAEGPPPVVERAYGAVHVDGVAQELREIGTPVPFVVAGARLNGVNGRKRPLPVSVWGLWTHVAPLPPGEHEVHLSGGDGYGFEVEALYRLAVGGAGPVYPTR
ncbi:hypothetical protein DQ237_14605 [Blastococcus sp. TF02-8]|uniref:hypothetical protein n=1 Tax=Blastococcus sp. TF02-8 TaxID=2250574 RepID=UPI000DE941E8|nr:hypothetical protein [Blastococcus sp. TF02-8]RBY95300.1 hypothetical protein DQ237_14605 [Blastococcus sp. TF02-8]